MGNILENNVFQKLKTSKNDDNVSAFIGGGAIFQIIFLRKLRSGAVQKLCRFGRRGVEKKTTRGGGGRIFKELLYTYLKIL